MSALLSPAKDRARASGASAAAEIAAALAKYAVPDMALARPSVQ